MHPSRLTRLGQDTLEAQLAAIGRRASAVDDRIHRRGALARPLCALLNFQTSRPRQPVESPVASSTGKAAAPTNEHDDNDRAILADFGVPSAISAGWPDEILPLVLDWLDKHAFVYEREVLGDGYRRVWWVLDDGSYDSSANHTYQHHANGFYGHNSRSNNEAGGGGGGIVTAASSSAAAGSIGSGSGSGSSSITPMVTGNPSAANIAVTLPRIDSTTPPDLLALEALVLDGLQAAILQGQRNLRPDVERAVSGEIARTQIHLAMAPDMLDRAVLREEIAWLEAQIGSVGQLEYLMGKEAQALGEAAARARALAGDEK